MEFKLILFTLGGNLFCCIFLYVNVLVKCGKGNQQPEYEREMKAAYRRQNIIPFLTHCS